MSRLDIRFSFVLALVLLWTNLSLSAHSQEGIPPNIGSGTYPPGLLESHDLESVAKPRIAALRDGVDVLQVRYERGLDNIKYLLDAQFELAVALSESTDDEQKKLQFLEKGLVSALKIWQQADLRIKAGLATNGDETLARAAVFRMRHLWLKEKARQDAAKLGDTDRKDPHESK